MTSSQTTPNAQQIEYWNGVIAQTWVRLQTRLDELNHKLTQVALEHAAPQPGERAIDIGCGCGATVLELARRVGLGGHVFGVDLSGPMLGLARRRTAEAGYTQVTLEQADMSTYAFAPQSFDLAFSRFGVMFFDNPVAAFANLRGALKPAGRLVFACFRSMAENPWVLEPLKAVQHLLPPSPPPGPEEPGQFAFADPDRVRRILGAAGFHDIVFTKYDPVMQLGSAAQAAEFSSQIGPVARALVGAPETLRTAVRDALTAAYRQHDGPDGVNLPGANWIVAAKV
ncbi:MAG TPA: class I SAM-dependent methyltransferase [Acetobacteraceae bacterium]|nr:class I SAM-dependent methyltransferase [Acetobacteraceae bacterium]